MSQQRSHKKQVTYSFSKPYEQAPVQPPQPRAESAQRVQAQPKRAHKNYFELLSSVTKSKLGELLLLVADEEIRIEGLRQNLASLKDFEPYASFTRIDRQRKDFISARDLSVFIAENKGRQFYESQVNYMIKYFDSKGFGNIAYFDFMAMILPCEDPYMRAIATQRPSTQEGLSALLEAEIQMHLNLEQVKKELESCFDFSLRRLFKSIDEIRAGHITEASLRQFLKRMGHQALKSEVIAIIRRFDLDGDSRISFPEFCEAIKSISPNMSPDPLKFQQAKRFSPTKNQPSPVRIEIENDQYRGSRRVKSADKTSAAGALRKKNKKNMLSLSKVTYDNNESSFMASPPQQRDQRNLDRTFLQQAYQQPQLLTNSFINQTETLNKSVNFRLGSEQSSKKKTHSKRTPSKQIQQPPMKFSHSPVKDTLNPNY